MTVEPRTETQALEQRITDALVTIRRDHPLLGLIALVVGFLIGFLAGAWSTVRELLRGIVRAMYRP